MLRRYVHGDQVDEPWVQYNGSTVGSYNIRYLHANHQGSIVAHSVNNGVLINKLSYDSYGIPGADNEGRFGYTGQLWLKDLGLNHYKARIYSPKLGRFLQTDPIGYADQMNMYAYVGNDPVNKIDPTGMQTYDPERMSELMRNMRNQEFRDAIVKGAKDLVEAVATGDESKLQKSASKLKVKGRGKNRVSDKVQGKPSSEQQSLIDMAKIDSRRMAQGKGPVSKEDADTYIELGNELKVPVRAKADDLSGAHPYGPVKAGPDASHIHVNGEHVPVPSGYTVPPNADVIQ